MSGFAQDYSEYDGPADEWGTPPEVWRPLSDAVGGFDLDPCAGAAPSPIAETQYYENGLRRDWFGVVWVNPPYSDPGSWLEKSILEVISKKAQTALLLLPARTHCNWFQDQLAHIEFVLFYRGKIKFHKAGEKSPNPAPFSTMLIGIGEIPKDLVEVGAGRGWVVRPPTETVELTQFTNTNNP